MDFKDTRLYELLRWVVAAAIGYILLGGLGLVEQKLVSLGSQTDYLELMDAAEQLLEEKKAALIASSGYEQIDEIISIEKQLIDIDEKENAITFPLQKKKKIAYIFLILIGFSLMLLSIFVTHSTIRLLLAVTGAVFSLGIGVLHITYDLSLLLQTILYLVLAASAYIIWQFLSKKNANLHRYLFLQIFGAFSLAYALYVFAPTINQYVFPSELAELVRSVNRMHEMQRLLQEEQNELLMNEQLSKEQKDRYVELANEKDAIFTKWREELPASLDIRQQQTAEGDKRRMFFSVFAVLYLLLGIFLSAPLLLSFGLIISGSWILLEFLKLDLSLGHSFTNSLSYSLFVGIVLLFVCYRLYHQHREAKLLS